MVWMDFEKIIDRISQSWIIDSLKMYLIPDNVMNVVENTMENWRVELTTGVKNLAEVEILRSS